MMKLDVSKTDNCFADAQTFEYRLPCQNEKLLEVFGGWGELTCKYNLRRPVFLLTMKDGTRVKGILKGLVLRSSFPTEGWEAAKEAFEALLSDVLEKEEACL